MIVVSFSSAEDALFNDVNNDTFRSQGTEHPLFRFLGDTRYKNFQNNEKKKKMSIPNDFMNSCAVVNVMSSIPSSHS